MEEQRVEERGGGLATRWVELVVAALLVAGGAVVIVDSIRIGASWGSDGPQGGYFPYLVGWSLSLAGIWIAGQALWRWKRLAGDAFVQWGELKTVLAMLLPTIAYVVLVAMIGIYVASALYIGAFMMWQGKYNLLKALAVALAVPAVTFALFEIWFLVPLPKGPIEHMLGF
jgi:hypothetical protein